MANILKIQKDENGKSYIQMPKDYDPDNPNISITVYPHLTIEEAYLKSCARDAQNQRSKDDSQAH